MKLELSAGFLGRYRIQDELGTGGMGAVYSALDMKLERLVAVKFLLDADADSRARFAREARALALVRHANVTRVYEVGLEAQRPYLVTELVQGESLLERLTRGPFGLEEFRRVAAGITQGLAAIHAAGLVHRDLKSANVLMATDGTPKICDFGLARSEDAQRVTTTGVVTGTAEYLAPELLCGGATGPALDVYALGCLFHEMLTGNVPFPMVAPDGSERAVSEVLRAHLAQEPPPLELAAPEAPARLRWLVRACLAKRPEERPALVPDVLDVLVQAPQAAGPTREVRSLVLPPDAASFAAPSGRSAALAMTVAFALGILLIGAFRSKSERPDPVVASASPSGPTPAQAAASELECRTIAIQLNAPPRPDQDEWLARARRHLGADLAPLERALLAAAQEERQRNGREYLPRSRVAAMLARAHALAGDHATAVEAARAAFRLHPDRVEPLATLLELGERPALTARAIYHADLDGAEMVWIPDGAFRMGIDAKVALGFGFKNAAEVPAHPVEVTGFFMDRHEVSVARYGVFNTWVKRTKDHLRCHPEGACRRGKLPSWGHLTVSQLPREFDLLVETRTRIIDRVPDTEEFTPYGQFQRNLDGGRQPVTAVSWYDAVAYAAWAGKQLPTEAQWEWAARGPDGRDHPWGNEPVAAERVNANRLHSGVMAVNAFDHVPSAFGVSCLAGNITEWCADAFDEHWYAQELARGTVRDPTGPAAGKRRVMRGGDWRSEPWYTRCATRTANIAADSNLYTWGFRTVRALRPIPPPAAKR